MLEQSEMDRAESLGQGKAACLLNETAAQAWLGFSSDLKTPLKRTLSLQRFDNICCLVKTVPVHQLQFSRKGAFWKEMEQVL